MGPKTNPAVERMKSALMDDLKLDIAMARFGFNGPGLTEGAIERAEADGAQMIASDPHKLPVELGSFGDTRDSHPEEWAPYEALGFRYLGPCEDDPIFMLVQFPDGWSKRRTDHPMWTEIVDAGGAVRGRIFYKSAFYDYRACVYLEPAARPGAGEE